MTLLRVFREKSYNNFTYVLKKKNIQHSEILRGVVTGDSMVHKWHKSEDLVDLLVSPRISKMVNHYRVVALEC